jgi:hypothetical protein
VNPKRYHKIFPKIQSIRGFFGISMFWNLSSTSGLSQICRIRNAWKLPGACLKDNSDPQLLKALKKFKYIILEAQLSNTLKVNDFFFAFKDFLQISETYGSVQIPGILGVF